MGCLMTLAIVAYTAVYWSPTSWNETRHSPLSPGDHVCVVEIKPGDHPLGVHWLENGQTHGGYIDEAHRAKQVSPY